MISGKETEEVISKRSDRDSDAVFAHQQDAKNVIAKIWRVAEHDIKHHSWTQFQR